MNEENKQELIPIGHRPGWTHYAIGGGSAVMDASGADTGSPAEGYRDSHFIVDDFDEDLNTVAMTVGGVDYQYVPFGADDLLPFDVMKRLYQQRIDISGAMMLASESFLRNDELSQRALRAHNGAHPVGSGKRQHINFKDNSDKWDYDTDREVLGTLLKNYRRQVSDPQWLPDFYQTIDRQFGGDCQAYADYLYKKSALTRKGRVYPNKKSFRKDLGVQYGLDLTLLQQRLQEAVMGLQDSIDRQERLLCDAKLRMEQDLPHYSDANFTLRMSYGQVKEYSLGGRPSGYYTASPSMVAKMRQGDAIEDYRVEPEMTRLLTATDFSPYADRSTGEMQLCFLTTNDITGGNSGSPMFDGQNRLIGLAFDGNWDSLSSDIFFDSQLARCIGVDIRYVLFMMDRWGHADRLLQEINAQ